MAKSLDFPIDIFYRKQQTDKDLERFSVGINMPLSLAKRKTLLARTCERMPIVHGCIRQVLSHF